MERSWSGVFSAFFYLNAAAIDCKAVRLWTVCVGMQGLTRSVPYSTCTQASRFGRPFFRPMFLLLHPRPLMKYTTFVKDNRFNHGS